MKIITILALALLSLLFTSCHENTTTPKNTNQNPPIKLDVLEKNALYLINNFRRENSKDTIEWNDYVASLARGHSKDMAIGKYELGYDEKQSRADSLEKHIPWQSFMEIVSSTKGNNPDKAQDTYNLWHTYNESILLGNYKIAGIGVDTSADATYYFMVIFVLPR
jgi:uncharacterized protein YkwD